MTALIRDDVFDQAPPGEDVGSDDPIGVTWQERPLAEIVAGVIDGTVTEETPTIGCRTDGTALFYPGRVNGLIGESGGGKTFVALHACTQQLAADQHVIFVDFEDRPANIVRRLIELGVEPAAIPDLFHYVGPDEAFGAAAQEQLADLLEAYRPTLVVIDSTGESMSMDDIKSNDDDAVARWGRRLPRWIAGQGPAVVTVDHVTKNADTRGLYAIGSQRKRAMIDGAAYMVDTITEAGRGQHGRAKLTVAKDKLGTHVRGSIAAEFHLDATLQPIAAALTPVERSVTAAGEFRPTVLMEKVSRWLEINQDASKSDVEKQKFGKAVYVRQAINALIAEGYLTVETVGQAMRLTVAAPFRDTPQESNEEP